MEEFENNVKFGIFESYSHYFGPHSIGCVFPINKAEMVAITMKETILFEGDEIKARARYNFCAGCYIPEVTLIVAHTYRGSELFAMQINDLSNPILSNFPTDQVGVYHMIYSPKSHAILTIGTGVKVWDVSWVDLGKKMFTTNSKVIITLRSTFALTYDSPMLNPPDFDYENERLYLPTPEGIRGYNLDGFPCDLITRLPADTSTIYSFCPHNKKVVTSDPVNGVIIWKKGAEMEKRITTLGPTILSLGFIDPQNILYLNANGSLFLINVKASRPFHCYDSPQMPTRLSIIKLYGRPHITFCMRSTFRLLRVVVPWKVWNLNISRPKTIARTPKCNCAAQIITQTDNSFIKIYSPQTRRPLVSTTPGEATTPHSYFYDRGTFVEYKYEELSRSYSEQAFKTTKEPRDYLFVAFDNGILVNYDMSVVPCVELWSSKMNALCVEIIKVPSTSADANNDAETGAEDENKVEAETEAETENENEVAKTSNDTWLYAVGRSDGGLSLLDYFTFKEVRTVSVCKEKIIGMLYHYHSDTIIFVLENKLQMIDLKTYQIIDTIRYHFTEVFSMHGNTIYLGGKEGEIERFEVINRRFFKGKSEIETKPHTERVTSFAFGKKYYLSASIDSTFMLWNYEHDKITLVTVPFPIYSISFLGPRREILLGMDTEVMIMDPTVLFGDEVDPEIEIIDNYDRKDDMLDPELLAMKALEEEAKKRQLINALFANTIAPETKRPRNFFKKALLMYQQKQALLQEKGRELFEKGGSAELPGDNRGGQFGGGGGMNDLLGDKDKDKAANSKDEKDNNQKSAPGSPSKDNSKPASNKVKRKKVRKDNDKDKDEQNKTNPENAMDLLSQMGSGKNNKDVTKSSGKKPEVDISKMNFAESSKNPENSQSKQKEGKQKAENEEGDENENEDNDDEDGESGEKGKKKSKSKGKSSKQDKSKSSTGKKSKQNEKANDKQKDKDQEKAKAKEKEKENEKQKQKQKEKDDANEKEKKNAKAKENNENKKADKAQKRQQSPTTASSAAKEANKQKSPSNTESKAQQQQESNPNTTATSNANNDSKNNNNNDNNKASSNKSGTAPTTISTTNPTGSSTTNSAKQPNSNSNKNNNDNSSSIKQPNTSTTPTASNSNNIANSGQPNTSAGAAGTNKDNNKNNSIKQPNATNNNTIGGNNSNGNNNNDKDKGQPGGASKSGDDKDNNKVTSDASKNGPSSSENGVKEIVDNPPNPAVVDENGNVLMSLSINSEGKPVNDKGEVLDNIFVDKDGHFVNEKGEYVNEKGEVIDPSDKIKYVSIASQYDYVTEDGTPIPGQEIEQEIQKNLQVAVEMDRATSDKAKEQIKDFHDAYEINNSPSETRSESKEEKEGQNEIGKGKENENKDEEGNNNNGDNEEGNDNNGDNEEGNDNNGDNEAENGNKGGNKGGIEGDNENDADQDSSKLVRMVDSKQKVERPSTPPPVRWHINDGKDDPDAMKFEPNNRRSCRTPPLKRKWKRWVKEDDHLPPPNFVLDPEAVLAMYGRGHTELLPLIERIRRDYVAYQTHIAPLPIVVKQGKTFRVIRPTFDASGTKLNIKFLLFPDNNFNNESSNRPYSNFNSDSYNSSNYRNIQASMKTFKPKVYKVIKKPRKKKEQPKNVDKNQEQKQADIPIISLSPVDMNNEEQQPQSNTAQSSVHFNDGAISPRPPSDRSSFTNSPHRKFEAWNRPAHLTQNQRGFQIKPLNVHGSSTKGGTEEEEKEEEVDFVMNKPKSARRNKRTEDVDDLKSPKSMTANFNELNKESENDLNATYSFNPVINPPRTRPATIKDYSYLLDSDATSSFSTSKNKMSASLRDMFPMTTKGPVKDDTRTILKALYKGGGYFVGGPQGNGMTRKLPNDLSYSMKLTRPSVKKKNSPNQNRKSNGFNSYYKQPANEV